MVLVPSSVCTVKLSGQRFFPFCIPQAHRALNVFARILLLAGAPHSDEWGKIFIRRNDTFVSKVSYYQVFLT